MQCRYALLQAVNFSLVWLFAYQALEKNCVLVPSRRGKRNSDRDRTAILEDRLTRMEDLMHATPVSGSYHRVSMPAREQPIAITPPSSFSLSLRDMSIPAINNEPENGADSSRGAERAHKTRLERSSQFRASAEHDVSTHRLLGSSNVRAPSIPSPTSIDYSSIHSSIANQAEDDSYIAENDKEEIAISPQKVRKAVLFLVK